MHASTITEHPNKASCTDSFVGMEPSRVTQSHPSNGTGESQLTNGRCCSMILQLEHQRVTRGPANDVCLVLPSGMLALESLGLLCWRWLYNQTSQRNAGTEPDPETGTVGTVLPGTESRRTTVRTIFQQPKPCTSA